MQCSAVWILDPRDSEMFHDALDRVKLAERRKKDAKRNEEKIKNYLTNETTELKG